MLLFRLLYPMITIGLILYLCLDVVREAIQLQSLTGIVVIMVFLYVTSRHPNRVSAGRLRAIN